MQMKKLCAAAILFSGSLLHGSGQWLVESQNTMQAAKQLFLTVLRNKDTSIADYRKATDMAASILAHEAIEHIAKRSIEIHTPLAPMDGTALDRPIVLLPIIRSGLTMLSTFLRHFEHAQVGFFGLARNEQTAQAHWYYEKFPHLKGNEQVIILEPMLATGGTLMEGLKVLEAQGAQQKNILIASIVCAPEGLKIIHDKFPEITIITLAVDTHLNTKKFIVPGLGDFGNRYFGVS